VINITTECDDVNWLQARQQHLSAAESQVPQASDKSSADTDVDLPVQIVEHPASEQAAADSDVCSAMPKV